MTALFLLVKVLLPTRLERKTLYILQPSLMIVSNQKIVALTSRSTCCEIAVCIFLMMQVIKLWHRRRIPCIHANSTQSVNSIIHKLSPYKLFVQNLSTFANIIWVWCMLQLTRVSMMSPLYSQSTSHSAGRITSQAWTRKDDWVYMSSVVEKGWLRPVDGETNQISLLKAFDLSYERQFKHIKCKTSWGFTRTHPTVYIYSAIPVMITYWYVCVHSFN